MNRALAIGLSLVITATIVITVIAVVSGKRSSDHSDETTSSTTASTTATTAKKNEPVAAEKVSFIAPIANGTVISQWSADIPVFSNTMEDYRVHLGVDIKADAGTPVYASADGTIETVEFDPMMGQTVIIKHNEGYKTVYRNLQTAIPDGIEAGASVKAGDQVGAVGDTALVEISEEPHLHFEIHKDAVCENPLDHIALKPVDASKDYED